MISLEYPRRDEVPASFHLAKLLDLVWMASLFFEYKTHQCGRDGIRNSLEI